jgi:alpha-ketoglutarate-dependent taurine dioxygenase
MITDVRGWAAESRGSIEALLNRHRAILFRGFGIASVERFNQLLEGAGTDPLEYTERSTPRSRVAGNIYTSTEYPKSHLIPLHNENSYSVTWPRRLYFCCLVPASMGGETPVADSRLVFQGIDEAIRGEFLKRQVMYVRTFGQGVDLSWQEAFQTVDPLQAEEYCRAASIEYEWFDNGVGLQTRQVRPAVLRPSAEDEWVWFNQAHLFHVSSLESSVRESLLQVFALDRLPRNALYGDGGAIELDALNHIRRAYDQASYPIAWEAGDVLLLDNLFFAHGRRPYHGDRTVVVAMDGRGQSREFPA